MNCLQSVYERNKKCLCFALMATFFWGLIAHGYGFLQSSFTHDSMTELNGYLFGNHFKLTSGRFISPIYRALVRTDITLPWLIGLLSLLWIGLAVFFVIKIFEIDSKVIAFLTAGIMTVNLTVSATAATFMHDFDCDMLALLCSVLAVYLWQTYRFGWILGAGFIMIALGIYQSYLTVTIVLVMFVCILWLMNGKSFKTVFFKGLKAIGMILLGGGIYAFGLKVAQRITHMELSSGNYNSLDKMLELTPDTFIMLFKEAYTTYHARLVNAISPYPAFTAGVANLLLILAVTILVIGLLNKKTGIMEKLLYLVLVALLPVAMNLMHILTIAMAHELMLYAFWLTYLLVLLLADWLVKQLKDIDFKVHFMGMPELLQLPRWIAIVLVFILTYSNVQTANAMYLKKDLETEAYMSLMTRVLYRMEDFDGYDAGVTPVVMIGTSDQINEVIPGFEKYRDPNGMYFSDVLIYMELDQCQSYFNYILNTPVNFVDWTTWQEMKVHPEVTAMPCYPEDGCVAMVNDILVVKLGE